jgi:hypothetical protein
MKVHSRQCLFDSVDNRNDLVTKIVAVCEQIPPEFLLNAAIGVSGSCRMYLRENGGNFEHLL